MIREKIKRLIVISLGTVVITNFIGLSLFNSKPVLAVPIGIHLNSDFENFGERVTEKKSHTDAFGNLCWMYNANRNSYFEKKVIDDFRSNSLALINTNNDSSGIYITKPSVKYNEKLVFESDLNFTDMNLERKISIRLNTSEISGNQDMYQIAFNKNGSIALSDYSKIYGTTQMGIISKENYKTNEWYNIKFIVDPQINEISIYLNNQLLDKRVFDIRSWDSITELRVTQSGSTSVYGGEVTLDNFRIYDYVDVEDIKLQDVTIKPNSSLALQKKVSPQIADTQLIYTSSNESIVSIDNYGILTAGSEKGTAQINAFSLDGSVKAVCEVKVDDIVEVEGIILPQDIQIQKGENLNLQELVSFIPENTTNKNIIWSTEDERRLKVDSDGNLTGVNWGEVKVIAKTQDGNKIATSKVKVKHVVNPPEIDSKEYKDIRERYFYNLTGGNYDYTDENTKSLVDKIFNEAQGYLSSMNREKEGREHIWDDLSDSKIISEGLDEKTINIKLSDAITTSYRRLETMLRAYHMEYSPLKNNQDLLAAILDALDWLYENKYNENLNVEYGNWWNWEIGTPLALTNIGILIHDEIDKDILKKYMEPIYFYQPDPFNNCFRELNPTNKTYHPTTGANRADCAKISAVLGAVVEDYEQLEMASDAIESLLEYTTSGDGFYEDGSFLQHGIIPYIGSYGYVFLTGVPTVVELLKDSEWEVSKERLGILKEFVDNSLIPFMYKGSMLDMTRGRAIARYNVTDKSAAKTVLNTIMMVARVLDNEDDKNELHSFVKGMIELSGDSNYMESIATLDYRQYPISIINDLNNLLIDDIKGLVNESYHKFTPIQDRVVHSRQDYLFGVSMFSKRTGNFESMNAENKRGWHTSSGMTYLYNNDLNYYKDFWPTVNPYRLPGTTIDTIEMVDAKGNKAKSDKDWVGGVHLGKYGTNGMEYHQVSPKGLINTSTGQVDRLSLEAHKSWFMFDDEIVALGSGINSSDGRVVESIIDNIKLKEDNSNSILVNNTEMKFNRIKQNITNNPMPTSDKDTIENVDTIYVEGNNNNVSVGYYFPKSTELNFRNVENTGTWQAIGASGPIENGLSKEIKKNYLEVWVDHGINPTDESYEYVILPNKSNEKLQDYKKAPNVEVLSNTSEIQGVKHIGLNMISFNSFVDSIQTLEFLTVNKKASVMSKLEKEALTIAISDPTMNNKEGIEITIDKNKLNIDGLELLTLKDNKDVNVLEENNEFITLLINTDEKKGETVKIEFDIKLESKPSEIIVSSIKNLKADNVNTNSIILSWEEPETTEGLVEYLIYKDGKLLTSVKDGTVSYMIDGLKTNSIYGFKVTAKYSNGEQSKPKSVNCRTKK